MNLKRTIGIALLVIAMPFINATGSKFTVYIPKTPEQLETHVQFFHGFYSSLQFMPHDVIRQSHGIYTIINDTVFMVSLHKELKFFNKNKKTSEIVKLNIKNHLNNVNIFKVNEKNNAIHLVKRLKNEKIDRIEIYGSMGFW